MKISFLLHNAYGIGGTIRSTFNLASALAARHTVEIVSLMRTAESPSLPLHDAVTIVPLIERRAGARGSDARDPGLSRPTAHVPAAEANGTKNFNALTDERVAAYLAATDADAVIATRPGLVIYLAEFGSDRYLRIGQEHRLHGTHKPDIRAACDAAIPRLDAFTSVSEADAATHRAKLPGIDTRLVGIPNAVPATPVEPSDGSAKLVVAAGRLIPVKRYDLLVDAWSTVAARHPEWRLRLYGRGPQQAALRKQIDALGLAGHITLMGAHSPIETEWAKGSIAAVTSREESFGMTIVEAMHCGVPVLATDCPHGPGEIITDGEDGLLVPNGDRDAIAAGLLRLIEDDELRRTMGRAARTAAQRYAPERVAATYERLLVELYEQRGTAPADRRPPRAPRQPLATTLKSAVKQLIRRQPPLRPVASCRADAEGNLTVLVEPAGLHGSDLELTVTRRGHGDRIRLPLRRPDAVQGADGPWTAVLDRAALSRAEGGTPFAEGRWDLHVVRPGDRARRRVVSRYAEGRGLVTLEPLPGAPFAWWVPYPTVDGYLAVRAWHRPAHAEARDVHATAEELTVEGTLHGGATRLGEGAVAVATPRKGADGPVTAPVTLLADGRFRFTLPYKEFQGRGVWDLSLREGAQDPAEPIRVARLIGDIVDRNKTDLYPLAGGFRPYFTTASNLAITTAAAG
ncbi:glycosyltransferase family 4 protein [Streptomyces sp. XD-27]|uniref:glycosyltransferase family 4 protein n=1 Tax=Streptomyces sp. XD-27 TaxID=3062779 RepID=UPI0026F44D3D|nr:glycosyltransferase family 4 protein [Streptomyces sp. XD-27]WKX72030.1 glycosyltransferase family 4 protein [Streptomyces sp. XD-27]